MFENTNISEERFTSFLQYLGRSSGVRAVGLALDGLDKGKGLAVALKKGEDGFGFMFDVEKLSDDRFKISLGSMTSAESGDGGEWEVGFSDDDSVMTCEGGQSWSI